MIDLFDSGTPVPGGVQGRPFAPKGFLSYDSAVTRYRFADFVVSPRQRLLLRAGHEQSLIPRYFDLLLFLIQHRREAVHRRDIFDHVWRDVVVSDSALSQAIRTIRRVLGDDSREPRFIRTVSRHGYQFVFTEVIEEEDREPEPVAPQLADVLVAPEVVPDAFEPLIDRLTRPAATSTDEEEQREAAELLHGLGTAEALRRLGTRPGHVMARALMRDTRWDTPGAGEVAILGGPAPVGVAMTTVRMRLTRAARIAAARWAGASTGSGIAGALAGVVGGALLVVAPGSTVPPSAIAVLGIIGAICGAVGGAGVGAGLALAEAATRSYRMPALVSGAALGGGIVGLAVQWLARWMLAGVVGVHVEVGGGIEGVVIGAAAAAGYALATSRMKDGLAAPRGGRRLRAAAITGLTCGVGALLLTLAERPLAGGTVHAIARASDGSQVALTPLARLLGEPDFGPITGTLIGTGEGLLFGVGLAFGLTRRP